MNNPIPLDLAHRIRAAYIDAPLDTTYSEDMQAALAAHLPDLAALPAVRDLVLADRREADVEVINRAMLDLHYDPEDALSDSRAIAAALSDATNGGHWEKGSEAYDRAMKAGWPRKAEHRGPSNSDPTFYGWVPTNPDAALLAIVDADTLARLREVAEVTAR